MPGTYCCTAYSDGYRPGYRGSTRGASRKEPSRYRERARRSVQVLGVSPPARRTAGRSGGDVGDVGVEGLREVHGMGAGAPYGRGASDAYGRRTDGSRSAVTASTPGERGNGGTGDVPRGARRAVLAMAGRDGDGEALRRYRERMYLPAPRQLGHVLHGVPVYRSPRWDVSSPSWLPLSVLEHGSAIASRPPERLTRSPTSATGALHRARRRPGRASGSP